MRSIVAVHFVSGFRAGPWVPPSPTLQAQNDPGGQWLTAGARLRCNVGAPGTVRHLRAVLVFLMSCEERFNLTHANWLISLMETRI